ncbi:MAG: PorT family protein [Bacteroidota bacterium]|nr:PorT family protein [Bacteroidota bacterium]
MKKQILLLASIIIATLSMAQFTPTYGIRIGATSSGVRGDAVNNLKSMIDFTNGMITTTDRTGFFAGGYANFPMDNVLSLEPAVYYSQKGYEMKGNLGIKGLGFLGANAKAKLSLQYIDIPVVIKANFGGLQLFAGPQFSYLVSADLKTTAGVLGFNLLNKKMDASNQFNKTDIAVTGGAGYQLSRTVNIRASYDYGLSKLDANKSLSSYNRSIKFGIGVSL